MESSVGLIKKIKEVEKAIEITKKLSDSYLKEKNFSEEEVKVWREELEKINSSEKVSQHMKKLIQLVQLTRQQTQISAPKKILNWIIVGGLILGTGTLITLAYWVRKKLSKKYIKR